MESKSHPNSENLVDLEKSWLKKLESEFQKPYMLDLRSFLKKRQAAKINIYPKGEEFFAALNLTPLNKVKVVIIGQDPYHGAGQAHGLSFSVKDGIRYPPSLLNIFKELKNDLGLDMPKTGDLTSWAEQGVLLLNAVLTVEEGKAAAHQGKGWELFTDQIIRTLNENRENLVYVLWGAYAQKKAGFVNRGKNLVIESAHPSPLSAHRGFLGSKPFSKINAYLRKNKIKEIDWALDQGH
ncbi:MAG: uracil-DNA glycosylase [Bdellovibrionaceae bacterium]|nr:uracil-DNA glycosylase [Pseudobdellovibrionaceae bacterium]